MKDSILVDASFSASVGNALESSGDETNDQIEAQYPAMFPLGYTKMTAAAANAKGKEKT